MDELGSILREAREAQGMTLAQVESATRINQRFLAALESGDYGVLPTPVHVRGYLRNYARYLQLDPQPLLERYEVSRAAVRNGSAERMDWEPDPAPDQQSRPDQPFFNPINFDVAGKRRDGESLMRLAIIAALIVFIGLAVNRFFLGNGNGDDGVTAAVNAVLGEGAATPATDTAGVTTISGAEAIVSTSRNESAPEPTPTRPRLPPTMEQIDLRLEITERTWMRVTIDGDVVFEGLGRQGETYEWTAQEAATVYTGNAIGIFVTINGTELGKLGSRSEIVDETWTTTGG